MGDHAGILGAVVFALLHGYPSLGQVKLALKRNNFLEGELVIQILWDPGHSNHIFPLLLTLPLCQLNSKESVPTRYSVHHFSRLPMFRQTMTKERGLPTVRKDEPVRDHGMDGFHSHGSDDSETFVYTQCALEGNGNF